MTRSDKQIIAIALAPNVIYVTVMMTLLALNPSHFPGAVLAAGGGAVAMISVGVASAMRLRRQRKPSA